MRKFTIKHRTGQVMFTVEADYMTRDVGIPNTLRFWVRGCRWWNRRRMVGAIENMHGEFIASSENLTADQDFLKSAGVHL